MNFFSHSFNDGTADLFQNEAIEAEERRLAEEGEAKKKAEEEARLNHKRKEAEKKAKKKADGSFKVC